MMADPVATETLSRLIAVAKKLTGPVPADAESVTDFLTEGLQELRAAVTALDGPTPVDPQVLGMAANWSWSVNELIALRTTNTDLLGALKRARHYMRNCGVNMDRDYPEIDAAIAKAGGR